MPRAKKYAGTLVYNDRYGHKKMHWLSTYYMYGLPLGLYSDAFDEIVKIVVKRYKAKMQTVIGIEGLTGSAKSTIAINLCYAIAKELGVDFDLDRDYIYGAVDVWRKLSDKSFSPICLYDEANISLNSKTGMTRDSIDLENAFNTLRDRGLISFICTPDITTIDKQVVNVHMEYLIRVYDERNPLKKGWGKGFFDFNDKKKSWNKSRTKSYIHWNVLFAGVFPDLTDEVKSIYHPIKKKHQDEQIERSKARYEQCKS